MPPPHHVALPQLRIEGSRSTTVKHLRHPKADELLYVLDGEIDITVLTDNGPVHATVGAGSIFVVPQGLWHRPVARVAVTLLSATPKPTEVSFAEDPRREG